jgi:serine/threonine protein kinase
MTAIEDVYQLHHFIDTYALGHYARVVEAHHTPSGARVALKIMRPEHLSADGEIRWEFRAFPHEAHLLLRLQGETVVRLIDCGYLCGTNTASEAPKSGQIVSFGTDAAAYADALATYAERGWRPYLALELLPRHDNLLYAMRPDRPSDRRRLATDDGLMLAVQFAQVLGRAHQQNIVYLDHKLEHVYWDGAHFKLIDLNSSRQLNAADPQMIVKDLHNLCVGVLYPIFTGLAPQKMSLRPQPGTREQAEDRYQGISTLDFGVEPTLPAALCQLIQRGADQQITSAAELLGELHSIGAAFGWGTSLGGQTHARSLQRQALERLRAGQAALREARDLLYEAAAADDLTDDMDAELRRLARLLTDLHNSRPMP